MSDVKQEYKIADLVREMEKLDCAEVWEEGESFGVLVAGCTSFCEVEIPADVLWSSECDDREQDEQAVYTESVLEYVLRELEKRARFWLKLVDVVRNGSK